MINHVKMYEINTRVWLHELSVEYKDRITLETVPIEIWDKILDKGFNWIWLMGIWENTLLDRKFLEKHQDLLNEINHSLPDWTLEDVLGSPYSITKYDVNPILGNSNGLRRIRKLLNEKGVKLMVDFVPNHFGISSSLVKTDPSYFINTDSNPKDRNLFDQVETNHGTLFIAYGKDPYFPSWDDTYQLNYFNLKTQNYMVDELQKIVSITDGIRCDMAMLCLNDVIQKTWGWLLNKQGWNRPEEEFWQIAIQTLKEKYPTVIFLAECYWDLEWQLQQLGFDYTYDKRLYDRLYFGDSTSINQHLQADLDYQQKSLRFIENHDEDRALLKFGEKTLAAAIISGTIPGIALYHQGQLEGYKIKIPVQIRRKKSEIINKEIYGKYNTILEFSSQNTVKFGEWQLNEVTEAWKENYTYTNILAWQWLYSKTENLSLIVINYSNLQSQARVHINLPGFIKRDDQFLILNDKMTSKSYKRAINELKNLGLYVDLKPYQSHLFNVIFSNERK